MFEKEYSLLNESTWEELVSRIDWHHSFLREIYMVSERFFCRTKDGEIGEANPDSPLFTTRIIWSIVTKDESEMRGLEFQCLDSYQTEVITDLERNPYLLCDDSKDTKWNLVIPRNGIGVVARKMLYRSIGEEYLGRRQLLGHSGPDEHWISAVALTGFWRQCTSCWEAWEELPSVEYSVCPKCFELTKWADGTARKD